jgi:hypothetical protein
VEFLASAGMSLLITAQEKMAPPRTFGVVARGSATSRPLALVGVDKIVAVFPSIDEALNALA